MNDKMPKLLEQVLPFLIIGIAVALFIGLAVMLSYVVVWGLVIGTILWGIVWIKDYLTTKNKPKKSSGRVIEHDDK